ncbi:MAG: hypothetical protein SPL48_00145 [Bacteroidales bacterium]|jgi:hypothetical protein|nr:hypothetical protein [Muribaculaceae bacterium]MCI6168555.1 hypothetical protein [Muribaculaceae bacterium]MDY6251124.1 hypothetical protein [Bacteroidales bacterium]
MMRFIIYAFFLLLSIGLLSSCRSAKPAKFLMLTADSIKYWNLTDGKFGIAYKKNHSFVEYDGKGMIYTDCISYKYFDIYHDSIRYFYGGREGIKTRDKLYYNADRIIKLTEDTLVLASCGKDARQRVFEKSKNQNIVLTVRPEERWGFKYPKLRKDINVDSIFSSLYTSVPKIAAPEQFSAQAYMLIGKDGDVANIDLKDCYPPRNEYPIFFDMLMSKIRLLKFVPARIEQDGKISETFEFNVALPISSKKKESR